MTDSPENVDPVAPVEAAPDSLGEMTELLDELRASIAQQVGQLRLHADKVRQLYDDVDRLERRLEQRQSGAPEQHDTEV